MSDGGREVDQVLGVASGETDMPDAATVGGEELLLEEGEGRRKGGLSRRGGRKGGQNGEEDVP